MSTKSGEDPHPLTPLVVAALAMFGVQAVPTGEEACFCYKDPETEAILADCQEIKGPNDAFPRISCRDLVEAKEAKEARLG